MPVKVRCPSCEKLLNAPDAARGKAIRCPGCQTKIHVPGEDEETAAPPRLLTRTATKQRVGQDSMEILANMDLSKLADSSASMCPKCGADIPEEATECPKCGVDPATGLLTEAAKRRLSRKGGIDPSKFYSVVWKDAWEFTKDNKRAVWRTILYAIISYGIVAGCGYMVLWCTRLPPKTFWAGFVVVAWQIFPGWIWHLRSETIRLTIAKKRDLRDVHFDMFQCVSLGIKTILWIALFCWMPGSALMFPLAMIHMAMPVTKRAWSWPSMLGTFFRNLGPSLYYWVIGFVMDLPLYAAAGLVAGLFFNEVLTIARTLQEGGEATIRWQLIATVSVLGAFSLYWFAFGSVFMMRVTALIAFYFRDTLDLVTRVPEKQYISKEIKLDAFGVPIKTRQDKINDAIKGAIALIVIGLVAFVIYRQLNPKEPAETGPQAPPGAEAPPAGAAPPAGNPQAAEQD